MIPTIYILDGSPAITGAFVAARNIARALAGHAKVVIVLDRNIEISDDEIKDFSDVKYVDIGHLRRSVPAIITYIPKLISSTIMLRRYLREDKSNVLIINDFYMMHGAMLKILGFSGRVFTWVRINPQLFGWLARIWLFAASATSEKIVAVSKYIKGNMPKKIECNIMYDCIDGRDTCLREYNTISVGKRFIFVGNYIFGKGQDIAIEALSKVVSECPDVSIEFYGSDMGLEKNKKYIASLKLRVRRLNLETNAKFRSFSNDKQEMFTGKIAALNLSRSESFSMTVLEASAAGIAVIATRCGGPEEIIQDGKTGLLIPVDDSEACADAMIRLCRDPEEAHQLGLAGRIRVLTKFSQEEFRRNLLILLGI